jgi:hypothetical protein
MEGVNLSMICLIYCKKELLNGQQIQIELISPTIEPEHVCQFTT